MRKISFAMLIGFAMLSITNFSFAGDSGYYVGFKTGVSVQDYNNVVFDNPRITGTARDSGADVSEIISFQVGKQFSFFVPLRFEVEYASTGEVTFDRHHDPFAQNRQRITIDSERLMFNLYHDCDFFDFVSMYAGAGVGLAFNETDALQGTSSEFADSTVTSTAWSVSAGVTKDIFTDYTIDVGYRYINLGDANTGGSQFAPSDEQFRGQLDAHEATFGVRYNF